MNWPNVGIFLRMSDRITGELHEVCNAGAGQSWSSFEGKTRGGQLQNGNLEIQRSTFPGRWFGSGIAVNLVAFAVAWHNCSRRCFPVGDLISDGGDSRHIPSSSPRRNSERFPANSWSEGMCWLPRFKRRNLKNPYIKVSFPVFGYCTDNPVISSLTFRANLDIFLNMMW